MVMGRPLELFWPDERVGEVGEQPRHDQTGEPIIEAHGWPPLKPVAGIGIGECGYEGAEAQGKQDEIEHGDLL